jgi:hypothetical protein
MNRLTLLAGALSLVLAGAALAQPSPTASYGPNGYTSPGSVGAPSSPATGGTGSNNSGATPGDLAAFGAAGALGDSGFTSSSAPITATGGTVSQTLAAMAAYTVNVKNFNAQGNLVSANAAFSITSGNNILTSSVGLFGTVYIGRAIIVPGAGVSGAPLITTIASFVSATQVTLTANASTTLSAVNLRIPIGTDDSAAINAAIVAAKNTLSQTPSFSAANIGVELYFPGGRYLALSGINLTGIANPGMTVWGDDATIYSAANGNAAVDGIGSRFIRWMGLNIQGDCYAPPNTGLQIGRTNTTALNSSDNHSFENISFSGCFSLASFYNLNAEQTSYTNMQAFNQYAGAQAGIFDGINHFGLTSQFITMSQPANSGESFNSNTCVDCIFYANGTPIWSASTSNLQFIGSYAVNTATSGPYYGMEIYSIAGSVTKELNADIHFEITGNPTFNSLFFIAGTQTTPSIYGFRYRDNGSFAGTSIFAADTNQTAITITGLDLEVAQWASGTPTVVDTPALYFGYATLIDLPSSSNYNLTGFSAQPCFQSTGSCSSYYSLPSPLSVPSIAPTGSVTTLTWVPPGDYTMISTSYTPTVTIAAPPAGGTTATAVVATLALNGYGTASGGTGYTNGSICSVYGNAGATLLFEFTSTVVSGAITGNTPYLNPGIASGNIPTSPSTVTCAGGGSGATVTNSVWIPATFTVNAAGSGYTTAPAATLSTTNFAGSNPHATTLINNNFSATGGVGAIALNATGTELGVSGTTGSPVVNLGALVDGSGVRQSLTSTYTVPANTSLVRFTQTGTLAASTVTLPTVHIDGQPIQFVNYAGTVTALTFSPTVNGWTNASALAPNTGMRIRWDATSAAWYREQ